MTFDPIYEEWKIYPRYTSDGTLVDFDGTFQSPCLPRFCEFNDQFHYVSIPSEISGRDRKEKVDWILDNVLGRWSLSGVSETIYPEKKKFYQRYSFEEETDAVLFKLHFW